MLHRVKETIKGKLKSVAGVAELEKELQKKNLQISYLRESLYALKKEVGAQKPIHVVFVCHRPQIWGALESVCDALLKDPDFRVTIVTVPNKKQLPKLGLSHEIYESEGADEYFSARYNCAVSGYDADTGEWLDLYSLKPDYVFFQTPYNICRPALYQSDVVSTYARLCYVHYGMPFMAGQIADDTTPADFFKDLTYHFVEFPEMEAYYSQRAKEFGYERNYHQILSGYPKLDAASAPQERTGGWAYTAGEKKFRILWTPRWNVGEGNCTFVEYKDKLLALAEKDPRIELLFRPHPQAFKEYVASGVMTEQEADAYLQRYESCPNAGIDRSGDYLDNFYTADLLISDESSIIPEFFLTGKPIVMTSHETHFNSFAKKLENGFYQADNWNDIEKIVDSLINGQDEKLELRRSIIEKEFYLPEKGAGYEIVQFLKRI